MRRQGIAQANKEQKVREVRPRESEKGKRGSKARVQGCKKMGYVCVQLVDVMYVFLSDLWMNAGTARREETGLSVGWDGIKRTSVESGVKAEI